MSRYRISELEALSGVKAHTIRIWEQRYNLLKPSRTDTNIRYYDDEQLLKILNVSTLLNAGMKISAVSKLTDEDIKQKLDETSLTEQATDMHAENLINQMIVSGLTYDQVKFEHAFNTALMRFGLTDTYTRLLYPALQKIGLLWSKTELFPAQEHFISALVRQKLCAAVDGLPPAPMESRKWVLFLPEAEDHELGLLFAQYLIRGHHQQVVYLGQRVPLENLTLTVRQSGATHLLMFLVRNHSEESLTKLLGEILDSNENCELIIACREQLVPDDNPHPRVGWVTGASEFESKYLK